MNTFLPSAGGYRKLRAFQLAEIICDLSMIFAKKFVRCGSRTRDQIEQAARSGKQNIAEGSEASRTSKETEIKLTNVAKASLEELLLDFEDHLRQNNLSLWGKEHPRTFHLREYLKSDHFMQNPTRFAERMNPEEFCNLMITLINQTTYLLRRLIDRQQQQFLEHGGIKEQMFRARINYRNSKSSE
ncbi:MAG: four helix bundle protein [Bacteroidales bacterium]|nr:four helix bundle protein [Bacteroidales bacterium]MBD5208801.1 four helix bundle protein [Bacteroidales bacterium]